MSVKKYKKLEYWNDRYQKEDNFEWFKSYQDFQHILLQYLNKSDRILMLGCGNSPFSFDLYADGFHSITNIDYSSVCIRKMKIKYKDCLKMKWLEMDMFNLQFDEESFDVVIEKGTIDALLVDEQDPWNISNDGFNSVTKALDQVSKVLKSGGKFLSITFSQPHFRKILYCRSQFQWSYNVNCLSSNACLEYFIFILKKGESLSETDQEYEKAMLCKRKKTLESNSIQNLPMKHFAESANSDDFIFNITL